MRFIGVLSLSLAMGVAVYAQRPRIADEGPTDASKAAPAPAPAPQSMEAKYEGGIFGHSKTMEGTLSFDDTNERLLFRNKQQKDVLFIPYKAIASAFADTQKRQPAAATVAQNIPIPYYNPFGLIKKKVRYLTIQFSDPDSNMSGITSFRLANKELLESVVFAVANKAGLEGRGDIYVRKAGNAKAKDVTIP